MKRVEKDSEELFELIVSDFLDHNISIIMISVSVQSTKLETIGWQS